MNMKLPKDVKYIIETLEKAGYEAYAVGGCVRDTLLGREPDDWDITTSAKPLEIKALFHPTIDTGIQHGTVTVLRNHVGYEVTTYRIDGVYEDSRHPKEVTFTANLSDDLLRRDFTINAMAYNDNTGIIDEFGGIQDLEAGIVKCVGNAEERFGEDALRIMRAVRFSAQLGYSIEEKTCEAIKKLACNLENISAERIHVELTKLLISPNPGFIRLAHETGILKVILPEIDELMMVEQNNPHHCYSVGEHTIRSMEAIEADKVLRYAMLFHDVGKSRTKTTSEDGIDHFHGHPKVSGQMTSAMGRRLKFDNDTLGKVLKLVENHDIDIHTEEKAVRRVMNRLGSDIFPMLLKVKKADTLAQSMYRREEKLNIIEQLWKIYDDIIARGDCVTIKDLAINGKDLMERGVKQGPEIGNILNELLDKVIDNPELNSRDTLLEML